MRISDWSADVCSSDLQRRPKHILSGMGVCGPCGSPWVRTTSDFWGCSRFRYGGPCTNNRLINNKGYQERVLTELKHGMLATEVVSAYVRQYHRTFARASSEERRAGKECVRPCGPGGSP